MLIPELDLLIAKDQTIRLDASSSAATRLKDVFRAMFISHFGGLVTGGDPNIALYGKWVKKILDPKIAAADKSHKREFTRTFKRVIGVDPIAKEPGLGEALDIYSAYNVNKITTLSHDYFNDIQDTVFRGLQSGTSNRSIVKEVQASIDKTGESSVANAKLIATDQIQKLNGDLDRKRQQSNGGNRYYWQTRRNGVVRNKNNSNGYSDHAQLEGAVFEWGNPPITVFKGKRAGERNEPGQDINCFPVGTRISTKEGNKNIEDINIGDLVQSHWGFQEVVGLNKKRYTGNLITIKFLHKTIRVTPRHKFFVNGRGWIEAQCLKKGDEPVKFKKLYSGYIFNEKAARDIKHPHPEFVDNELMPSGINQAHCALYFNERVKLIKKNVRLIMNTVFFVRLLKAVLWNIANTKRLKPFMTNFFGFGNNPVFSVATATSSTCLSSESRDLSFGVSDPLSGDSFRASSNRYPVIFKGLSNCTASHSSNFRKFTVRPKIINILLYKHIFKAYSKFRFHLLKPHFERSFVGTIFRAVKPSIIFNSCFRGFKHLPAVATLFADFWHNSPLLKGSSKQLHYVVAGVDCQHVEGECVYNFEVKNSMSYFAEGFLVENCKCLASMVIDDLLDKKSKKLIAAEAKTEKLRQRGVL